MEGRPGSAEYSLSIVRAVGRRNFLTSHHSCWSRGFDGVLGLRRAHGEALIDARTAQVAYVTRSFDMPSMGHCALDQVALASTPPLVFGAGIEEPTFRGGPAPGQR